jgi:S-adenosylmethionine synthetase
MKNKINNYIFASESVSPGHPDKLCDQISDAILDLYLKEDPESRVAAEVMATPTKIIIAGETRGADSITKKDIEELVRSCVKHIGYEQSLFNWSSIEVENLLIKQSPDIALGVDATESKEEGAGDQGIMFGFAVDDTPELMPAPIYYANKILENIFIAIKNKEITDLGPDAKSQVSLQYIDNKPVHATSIVVSIQHAAHLTQEDVRNIIRPYVLKSFPNKDWLCAEDKFYVNPTGKFIIGGPEGDAGLTGRKIIVDTYGGAAPHGGGAFSGKDPSKVDRSGAYAARYIAKNIVAAKIATKCTIQISYAIGVTKPLSLYVDTHQTSQFSEQEIIKFLEQEIDLSPHGIKTRMDLKRPIYQPTATFGHFGRAYQEEGNLFPWERLDMVAALKKYFKI